MTHSTDIVIHINDLMDDQQKHSFSEKVRALNGVVSTDTENVQPHFMIIAYNSGKTKANEIVASIKETGLQAQLISWL